MTGFLIYDWIEQPKKQEIIQEVLKLLEQKVLEPHSGEYQCAVSAFGCSHGPARCISMYGSSLHGAMQICSCYCMLPVGDAQSTCNKLEQAAGGVYRS